MIAKQNAALKQATETLYALNCDQTIRDMCRAREDAIRHENRMKRELAEANAALAERDAALADAKAEISDAKATIADKDAKLADKDAKLAEANAALSDAMAEIARLKSNQENK